MESIRFKLGLCLFLIFIFFTARSLRKGNFIDAHNFVEVSLASASIVLAISLIIKVFLEEEVSKILKEDTISLLIGAGSQIIVSLNPDIREDSKFIFKKIKFLAFWSFPDKKRNK